MKNIKKIIAKKLGKHSGLTQYEEAYIENWVLDFGYDMNVIEIALKRTTLKQNPTFDYINNIITDWHDRNLKTPDEVKKYQKILSNKDAILADAKEQADAIINAAQVQTEELINEHEIMQRAYAQANELIEQATAQAQAILDNATEEANSIRYGAMQYTDDMLAKLQYIIEHSIKDNKEKYDSLLSGLENVLSVVNNNRNELSGIEEGETEETVQNNSEDSDSTDTDNNE